MDNLYTKIVLYLRANSKDYEVEKNNIAMQNDGNGAYIKSWNVSGLSKPTDDQLNSYSSEVATEEANEVVKVNRKKEYPSIVDQLDDIYHNGIDGWKTTIKAVKDKYPKE